MTPRFLCFHMAAVLLTALSPWAEDADVPHGATLPAVASASVVHADTIRVAPPTGEKETDRANVQAAFDAVQPGGTVLFAPGTYLLGGGARLTVPDVTVLGHPEGTVVRGCDPEAFSLEASPMALVFRCTGFYVEAERQTIRGLTFEYTWHGIVVGPFPASAEEAAALGESGEQLSLYPAGGQRIEGNTFRNTPNGLRVLGTGNERSVVRDNDFIDVFHAIGIYGAPLHFLDNRVTVEEPGGVPFSRHPGSAILISPGHTDCAGHVVAGNRVEGYPGAIYVLANRSQTCRDVEIRDNTIEVRRVQVPEAWIGATPTEDDSTMVGVPITLTSTDQPLPGVPDAETEGGVENIVIEGNRLIGSEGLGILVNGSRNRISGNTISGIQRREPFPGITWIGRDYTTWEVANGSAIWLSPGSDGNEIVGNAFEDVAGAEVFLEGDCNRVELRSETDSVRDLGMDNEVIATDSAGSGTDGRVARIDSIFSDLDSEDSPGCAAGVYRAGDVVFARGYGMASLEHGIPLSPRSVLGAGSIAKQFTALAVVLLAQRGELSLDDPVREHIPELPAYAAPVTVRHLIHHTSGLRDNVALLRLARGQVEGDSERVTLSMLAWQEALNFRPGEHWMYSNPGYLLLARIVEHVTGQSFREFTAGEIFDPLGMTNTSFLGPVTTDGRALACEPFGTDGYRVRVPTHTLPGSTGLYTTIEDLAKWDRNFYEGDVGGPEGMALVHAPGRLNSGRETAYAFGLELGRYRGLRTVWHSGGDPGYASMLLRFPDQRLSVALLCNMTAANPWIRAYDVADHYLADEVLAGPDPSDAARSANVSVTREELEMRTGVYESRDGISLQHFTVEDGALVVTVAGGRYPLTPVGGRRFRDGLTHFALTFRDAEPEGEMFAVWSPNPTSRSRQPLRLSRIGPRWTPRPGDLAGYTGSFYNEELDASWWIVVRDGELVLRRWGVVDQPLWSLLEDTFSFQGRTDPRLRFQREADGSITGFSLSSDQIMDMEFVRTRDRDARR